MAGWGCPTRRRGNSVGRLEIDGRVSLLADCDNKVSRTQGRETDRRIICRYGGMVAQGPIRCQHRGGRREFWCVQSSRAWSTASNRQRDGFRPAGAGASEAAAASGAGAMIGVGRRVSLQTCQIEHGGGWKSRHPAWNGEARVRGRPLDAGPSSRGSAHRNCGHRVPLEPLRSSRAGLQAVDAEAFVESAQQILPLSPLHWGIPRRGD